MKNLNILFNNDKYTPKNTVEKIIIKKNKFFKKVLFIDGGQSIILNTPSKLIVFFRVAGIVMDYENKWKIKRIKKDVIVEIKNFHKTKIEIKKEEFGEEIYKLKELVINSSGEISREKIDGVVSNYRKAIEILGLKQILKEEKFEGLVVLDGILLFNDFELKILNEILNEEIVLCSVAKSTNLVTDDSNFVLDKVMEFDEKDIFYLRNFVDIDRNEHPANMYFAKFSKITRYPFRVEIHKKFEKFEEEVGN